MEVERESGGGKREWRWKERVEVERESGASNLALSPIANRVQSPQYCDSPVNSINNVTVLLTP